MSVQLGTTSTGAVKPLLVAADGSLVTDVQLTLEEGVSFDLIGVGDSSAANQLLANTKLDTLHTDVVALQTLVTTLLGQTNPATLTTVAGTIAIDESLSAAITIGGKQIVRLSMPDTWTAASITFQTSPDNVTYSNLFDRAGTEYSLVIVADHSVSLDPAVFGSVKYLKLRSGPAAAAVAQAAERVITLELRIN